MSHDSTGIAVDDLLSVLEEAFRAGLLLQSSLNLFNN